MKPIIHLSYAEDGCNIYKCLNCKGEINLRTGIQHIKFCPYCGSPVYLKKFENKRKQRVIDAWARVYPDKKHYLWEDIIYEIKPKLYETKIKRVSIVLIQTREYCWGLTEADIEQETDEEVLRTYDGFIVDRYACLTYQIKNDLQYYKQKYNKIMEKDKHRSVFDEMGSRLLNFKLKVEIERK